MSNNDLKKNGEGYYDPTAYEAIKKINEEERFYKLLHTIFYICRLAGFEVYGRINLRDKKTGRIWK